MARRVLTGLQGASVVFHSTNAVRDEVLRHGLVSADRLIHAPYGVAREFTPGATAVPFCVPYLLHVGSTIPRKRIDVLLDVFARVRKRLPRMQLIHVGADLTAEQHRHLDSLGLRDATSLLPTRTRAQVADLYRGAQLVLLPSDAEGFGLPVIEAMACGTNVVTSDLAVLREVGAGAVSYCAVGDIDQWTETIIRLIESPEHRPSSQLLEARAALYTWSAHARTIVDTYCELFDRLSPNVKSGGRKY
jgi:glycosyltransferase involved in cell wall biosynthesis